MAPNICDALVLFQLHVVRNGDQFDVELRIYLCKELPPKKSNMRVLFVPQTPYFLARYGMEVLQLKILAELEIAGVKVTRFDPWATTLDVDVVHIFGSEAVHSGMVDKLYARGIPIVTTAMFMPIRSRWQYAAYNMVRKLIPSPVTDLRQRILQRSDHIIALTAWERDVVRDWLQVRDTEISVSALGTDDRYFTAQKDAFVDAYGLEDFVLSVGRIDRVKNQVRLATAMRKADIPTVFIGSGVKNGLQGDSRFVQEFQEIIDSSSNLRWISEIDNDDPKLPSAYAAARVHALASVIEGQGMVTYEAAATGCNIVVSNIPSQVELFGSYAAYVDPTNIESMQDVISREYQKERGYNRFAPEMYRTWKDVAADHIKIYEDVLRKRG